MTTHYNHDIIILSKKGEIIINDYKFEVGDKVSCKGEKYNGKGIVLERELFTFGQDNLYLVKLFKTKENVLIKEKYLTFDKQIELVIPVKKNGKNFKVKIVEK